MGDIVATIQAEQDEAIRADLPGPLVVAGGPGTGKTAVALHRAAYLLYTFRRRLGAQGVLLVGPSPVFLRYIEHVLPSLGEQDVQLSTIAGLRPSLQDPRHRPDAAAGALKGDARMAQRHRARGRRPRAPAPQRLHAAHRRTAAARAPPRDRAPHRRRAPPARHAQRAAPAPRAALRRPAGRALQGRRDPRRTTGAPTTRPPRTSRASSTATARSTRASPARWCAARHRPKAGSRSCGRGMRGRPEVKEALDRMWPVLSGAELVNDLFGFSALVRSAAQDVLTDDEQALLHRARARDVADGRVDRRRRRAHRRGRPASRPGRGGAARGAGGRRTATKSSTARRG